jgi:hypothetical protein
MRSRRAALSLVVAFALALPFAASAGARGPVIQNLEVQAALSQEGILSVEETLTWFSDADGPLPRDFTRGVSGHYTKSGDAKDKTGFVLLSATLDGNPIRINIRRNPDNLRLTLLTQNSKIKSGLHVFKLKYELVNMVVFNLGHDMMIWRLVRESSYPIERAAVSVKLPETVPVAKNGDPFRSFSGQLDGLSEGEGTETGTGTGTGTGKLSTFVPIEEGKSLTLYMSWDKGLVTEILPGVSRWRVWDAAVLALLVLYYAAIGVIYGRPASPKDPAKPAPATPESQEGFGLAPYGLSPGLLRYVCDAGLSARALTAELLSLAVKGYIQVENFIADETNETNEKPQHEKPLKKAGAKKRYSSLELMMGRRYRLRANVDPDADCLTATEGVLLHSLFSKYGQTAFNLDETCCARFEAAFRALDRNFASLGRGFFFQHMRRWVFGLFIFEAYTAFVMFKALSQGVGGIEPDMGHALAFMAPLFFLTPLLGGEKIWKQSTPMFILRTMVPLFFCACSLAVLRHQGMDPVSIAALAGCVAVIGFFWKIAPIRSEKGLSLLRKVDGFKLGLGSRAELREEDGLEKFESLLPYAYAFGLESALINRYDSLISRQRRNAKWGAGEGRGRSGAEYHTITYELGEAVKAVLPLG